MVSLHVIFKLSILSLVSLVSLTSLVAALEYNQLIDWNEYLARFPHIQINENSKEHFIKNVKYIIEHNSENRSYKLGITQFLHLSDDEWRGRFTNITRDESQGEIFESVSLNLRGTPTSWDWRTAGVTTPVKDQKVFGCCYEFSATETIETAYAIKTGKLLTLSTQQGVDCSKLNHGVNGGLPDYSYMYAEKVEKCLDSDYPYVGAPSSCHSCTGAVPKLKSYVDVKSGDENAMLQAVLITSLAVGIKADDKQFQMYKSGVLDYDCDNSDKAIDHAVVVEGYGTENGKDYWLVRNSWSQEWGLDGYVKMVRGKCMCGICKMASYPVF